MDTSSERVHAALAYEGRLLALADRHEKRMILAGAFVLVTTVLAVIAATSIGRASMALLILPAIALVAFFFQGLLRSLAMGMILDLPEVKDAMANGQSLPVETVRWMIARQRIWRSMIRTGIWMAAEVGFVLLTILWEQ